LGHLQEEVVVEQIVEVNENKYRLGWGKFILFFLTFIGISLVFGLFSGVFIGFKSVITGEDIEEAVLAFQLSPWILYLDFIAFILAFIIFKSVRQFLKKSLSFAPLKQMKTYGYIAVGFLIILISQYIILGVLRWESPGEDMEMFGVNPTTANWFSITILFISVVLITPIKEEFIYRGVLHGFLAEKWHFWLGLIISSVIFGFLHFGYPMTATIMGIVFVALYRLTRTLIIPIILHILWNGYVVVVFLFQMSS